MKPVLVQHGPHRWVIACLLTMLTALARADALSIEVHGIQDPLLSNVQNRVASFAVRGEARLSQRRLRRIVEDVAAEATLAVRPFGYYQAEVRTELTETGDGQWRLDVHLRRGPAMTVGSARIELKGAGADHRAFRDWREEWPLKPGKRLDHRTWEEQKRSVMDLAEAHGYLTAAFTEQRIEIDLESNRADLALELDTGPRAILGSVEFDQQILRPGILENLPRFDEGQPYDIWLLDRFRSDLWGTGYFQDIELVEERRLEESPPRVNLLIRTELRNRNTYQGSLGYGTDTGIRAQLLWSHHLLSSRGDLLSMGIGWQEQNEEYSFRAHYKLPRRIRAREYWTGDLFIRRENQDLEVRPQSDEADFIKLANGDVTDYSIRAGRLIVRDLAGGYQQLFENWYLQFVVEDNTFDESALALHRDGVPLTDREFEEFDDINSSLAVGVNWDWPAVRGSGFRTVGHHERAWFFTANEAWGSEKTFTQAYLSTSWHTLLGDRFKLLVRGEVGYSDARVDELELDLGEQSLGLSLTSLPNIYRFKAGGSRSVRGYAFESLSDNGLGSNNIVTASAEVEMNFREDWSVAAFYDVGNAFNSWSDVELKRGAGVGVRWYSLVGAIRLDFAQALDFSGEPWRIHFTIGTPLL